MKKLLLISGSPRGKNSSSRRIALQFIAGMQQRGDYEVEEFVCAEHELHPCKGCLYCWKNEAGKCVQQDDMTQFMASYLAADIVAWAFPNYFYGMPSTVKMVLERLLPIEEPALEQIAPERTKHFRRYDLSQKQYLLFVTCGFYNRKNNTEAIETQFGYYYGDRCEKVICTEGELFRQDFMRAYTLPYLKTLEKAGAEYADGAISEETRKALETPMLELERYLAFTNTNALLRGEEETDAQFRLREAKTLMQLMALTYIPGDTAGQRLVLEIELTDRDYTCQLLMQDGKCIVQEPSEPFHLKVQAPMQFFRPKQTLEDALRGKGSRNAVDLETLVALTQRCAKTGKPKTMRFGDK